MLYIYIGHHHLPANGYKWIHNSGDVVHVLLLGILSKYIILLLLLIDQAKERPACLRFAFAAFPSPRRRRLMRSEHEAFCVLLFQLVDDMYLYYNIAVELERYQYIQNTDSSTYSI